jgi:hypothetical protein
MTIAELCPDDLLLAARQGQLSALDDAKLSFHLQRCARCRATLDVGRAFDGVLGARAGDDRIASAIAASMVAPRRRRRLAYATLAGVLLTGSLAGAALSGVDFERWVGREPPARAPMRPAADHARPRIDSGRAQSGPTTDAAPTPAEALLVPSAARTAPKTPTATPNASGLSAPELFREANELRSQGRTAEAQSRYRDLQARFPSATEARVSLVSIARLELGAQPAAALRHFDAYLAQSAHRTLAEEALFGRATALGRLGRKAQERAAWQELLARFPASVYASQAQSRLQQAP